MKLWSSLNQISQVEQVKEGINNGNLYDHLERDC
jgi:hypothetical protein